MCGLVGVAGDTSVSWKDTVFNQLLVVDSLRGTHSTGVALVERFQSEMHMAKEVGHPFNLMATQAYQDMMKKPAKVIIGHNRYATLGKHSVENAHPFQFEHVVGAHNGTLEKSSIRDLHNHLKYDTDSQAIFSNINEFGIADTVSKLQGAWALTWFDKRDNTLNMLRNNKRPLYYAYSDDHNTILWASEEDMMKLVIGRSFKKVKDEEWYVVPEDTHLSWELPKFMNDKFEAPNMVERKGKPPAPVVTYTYGGPNHKGRNGSGASSDNYYGMYGYYDDEYWDNVADAADLNVVVPKQDDKGNKVIDFPKDNRKKIRKDTKKFRPPYKDHAGRILNKEKFHALVETGCVFCSEKNIKWGDFIHPLKSVDGSNIFLCEGCYNDDEIYEICESLI